MQLFGYKIAELHGLLIKKEITACDLIGESFRRIAGVDDKINAFLTLDEEGAWEQARRLDDGVYASNHYSLLYGMPAGLKDNIVTKGLRTTAGSKMLESFDPIYDASVVQRLKEVEAITVGKLNMDEFAMGSSNENSAFKTTKNPWNTDYVPGGSSGGPAAAVAAGEVLFSLGSDTGGSIRQPASYCGVVGLKPTYGRVSRYGLIAFASSLDQIGPITRNVEENAYVLQAISGYDHMDSTSAQTEVPDYLSALTGNVQGLRIAVPKEFMGEGVAPEVRQSVRDSINVLEQMGAVCDEVSLPHSQYALSVYYILSSSEASSNLARYDGVRYGHRTGHAKDLLELYELSRSEGFGGEVKRRIMLGTFALSSGYYEAYYKKAQQVRTLIKQDFEDIFSRYDVIIGPSAPTPAFKFGEKISDPLTMYANDILTIPASLAGVPAISIPCGFSNGLPLGLQIIGRHFDESTVYRVAHAYEQEAGYYKEKPALQGGET